MADSSLGMRKQFILRAVVDDYVRTAEPVGSKLLVERYQLSIRPATVRNEMAEMSDMGYLLQPHTSAGRIPSDRGYRFYVNWLMPAAAGDDEAESRAGAVRRIVSEEMDEVLRQTCRILSSLTNYTSVAAAPEMQSAAVRQIHLTHMDAHRVLVVVIPDSGMVKHRSVEVPAVVTPTKLTVLGNYLNEQLRGRPSEQIPDVPPPLPDSLAGVETLCRRVIEVVRDLLRLEADAEVVVEGAGRMVRQPEFKDAEQLERLFSALEERRSLLEMLQRASSGSSAVTVVIGGEQPRDEMRSCSLVVGRYTDGTGRTGAIGVIGPTRMAYDSTVSTVGLVAHHLTDLLTRRRLS